MTTGTLILNGDVREVVSLDDEQSKTDNVVEFSENFSTDELHDEDESSDSEEDDVYDEVTSDLSEILGTYDFAIILNSETTDINFIVPSPNHDDPEFLEISQNFSQNSFLLNYINYAINNREWLDSYAQNFQNETSKFMDTLLDFMKNGNTSEFSPDFINELKNLQQGIESQVDNEEVSDDSNVVDFTEALQKLTANKPKIIT